MGNLLCTQSKAPNHQIQTSQSWKIICWLLPSAHTAMVLINQYVGVLIDIHLDLIHITCLNGRKVYLPQEILVNLLLEKMISTVDKKRKSDVGTRANQLRGKIKGNDKIYFIRPFVVVSNCILLLNHKQRSLLSLLLKLSLRRHNSNQNLEEQPSQELAKLPKVNTLQFCKIS